MLLVQILILVSGVFAQNELKLTYTTFCLLFCLYLFYVKRYKSMCFTAFICLSMTLSNMDLISPITYKKGELLDFSITTFKPIKKHFFVFKNLNDIRLNMAHQNVNINKTILYYINPIKC